MERDSDLGDAHGRAPAGPADDVAAPTPTPYGMLLREIVGLARRYHGLLAGSLDLNASALDAMDWLIRDGALTPTELSSRLGISPGATTSVVKRLEDTGHAQRVENDADRRSVRVVAAEESIATAGARLRPLLVALDSRVSRYTPEQVALVTEFLADVADAYREGIAVLEAGQADAPPGR